MRRKKVIIIGALGMDNRFGFNAFWHVGYTGAAVLPHAIRLKNIIIALILSLYSAGMMYI